MNQNLWKDLYIKVISSNIPLPSSCSNDYRQFWVKIYPYFFKVRSSFPEYWKEPYLDFSSIHENELPNIDLRLAVLEEKRKTSEAFAMLFASNGTTMEQPKLSHDFGPPFGKIGLGGCVYKIRTEHPILGFSLFYPNDSDLEYRLDRGINHYGGDYDIFIVLYCSQSRSSFDYANRLLFLILKVFSTDWYKLHFPNETGYYTYARFPVVLVASNSDIVKGELKRSEEKEREVPVDVEEGRQLATKYWCPFVEVSCTKQNLKSIKEAVVIGLREWIYFTNKGQFKQTKVTEPKVVERSNYPSCDIL